ncbi:MAG: hypothetical protein EPN97_02650 [Alphaproteobacteria bacterium]|nr:MAG: hypothetical protein EPN97_02650 [Alphaproteobacteria bacterium]
MAEDVEKKAVREGLKRTLSTEFNRVSGRVVMIDDLVSNFDNLAGNNLGLFERGIASGKIRELAANLPASQGVYSSGGSNFVSAEFLKNGIMDAIDKGKLDGLEDAGRRAGITTVQAVEKSADHSGSVASGRIKPKSP